MAEKFLDKEGLAYYDQAQKQRINNLRNEIGTSLEDVGTKTNQETIISKLDNDIKPSLEILVEKVNPVESGLFYILISCSEDYNGHTFTATHKTSHQVYTGEAQGGSARIAVKEAGEYTITNDYDSVSKTVTIVDETNIEFTTFTATINVTVPTELIGQTVTCSLESVNLEKEAESTQVSFTVTKAGTYNIGIKDNSYITTTAEVSESGQSVSASLDITGGNIPIIEVTLAPELVGDTITCTKDQINLKQKASSTTVKFILGTLGEYTVGVDSNSYIKTTVNVEQPKTYKTSLTIEETGIPIIVATAKTEDNGKTLKCVKDETTLEKVIADRKATFILPETGTWKLTCDDYPEKDKDVNVAEAKQYKVCYNASIFGFTVDNSNSSPGTRVEYTDDAVGMEPAKMGSGSFNWGDWKEVFFNEQNHVYRISPDGTVGKQVKDDNYGQFVDGGDSGINGSGHNDNFMASMPTVWVYRGMEGNKRVVKISEAQVDESYKAYAHTNESGEVLDFIYWPTFRGSDVSGKMRSISDHELMNNKTAEYETTAAKANGSRWYTFDWADYQLRNDLLTLMFKSTDLQTALGKGVSSASAQVHSGTLNTRGAFWGDQTGQNEVKAFHCEAPWGNMYLRIAGCTTTGATMKVKMTRPYNTTGSGYTTVSPPCSTSGGYMSAGTATEYGLIPTAVSGSETTYECDYFYNNTTDAYAYVGGPWDNASYCGPWYLYLSDAASLAAAYIGSALSLK